MIWYDMTSYDITWYDMWVGCVTLKESSQHLSCDAHVE